MTETQQVIRDRIDHCESTSDLVSIGNEYVETEPALAARAYRKALLTMHHDGVLHNNLGVAYWNMGNHGDALKSFEQAIKIIPDDANVIQNFAGALLDLGNPEKARVWYKKANNLKPGKHTLMAYIDLHGY